MVIAIPSYPPLLDAYVEAGLIKKKKLTSEDLSILGTIVETLGELDTTKSG